MKDRWRIEEIIVVEGKDDTRRLQEVFDVDTIETIGSAIDETILSQIEHAQETRGVIVFTDPDFSGEKIRKIIMEAVGCPTCLCLEAKLHQRKGQFRCGTR